MLADPNGSNGPASPPPFSPPNHAVWVNALWFLSLVISLTCAFLATLLQQWARRYLKITQSRYSPHKRARIRAFFSEGVTKCLLPWTVDTLPTLLHISLFLFFAGLVVFLCNVSLTIFKLVLSWVSLCVALYGCITCMPIIRHDSPYYTPLSLPAWHIVTGTRFLVYRFLRWFTGFVFVHFRAFGHFHHPVLHRLYYLEESCHKSLLQGMQKTIEETALKSPSEIDTRAFMWTFDCLDEDHELERFFSGLPGFRGSDVVNDPLPVLTEEEKSKLSEGLLGLVDRTFSSDLLLSTVKDRRALICVKAVDPEHIIVRSGRFEYSPIAFCILHDILSKYQYSGPVATGIAIAVRGWGNTIGEDYSYQAQCTVSKVIATSRPRDDSWYNLASNTLGIPETSLRDYAAHGDDLSLLILIFIVRWQFNHLRKHRYSSSSHLEQVLDAALKFNIKNTSPKFQHEFCALWNEILNEAQHGDDHNIALLILREIRNAFLYLHQDTDSAPTLFSASTRPWDDILQCPSTYPVCKVSGHHSDSTPHIHDDGVSAILAHAIPHDHSNTTVIPFLTSPDPPSLSTHSPVPIDEVFTDALPLDNQISITGSTQHTGQMTTESRRIPPTSPSVVTTYAMHLPASEASTSGPPPKSNASASPPDAVAVGLTTLNRTPSGDLNVLSSPSPPVLDAPTGLLLFSGRNLI